MLSTEECMAKAYELEVQHVSCADPAMRHGFLELAAKWRAMAVMAKQQESARSFLQE